MHTLYKSKNKYLYNKLLTFIFSPTEIVFSNLKDIKMKKVILYLLVLFFKNVIFFYNYLYIFFPF